MSNLEILSLSWLIAYLICIPGLWMIFKKLEIIPWYSLIPIFNFIVLMKYYQLSMWYLVIIIFGPIWLIFMFLVNYKIAKSFGLGFGFALGLTLWFTSPIFTNLLGFGNYEFIGKEGIV